MTDNQNPKFPPPPSSSSNSRAPSETSHHGSSGISADAQKHHFLNPPEIGYNGRNGHKQHYPHPPDPMNPDAATLREQWMFATRQYGRWYSQAWGSAILAGLAFFALGWIIKGSNPLPSFRNSQDETKKQLQPQQHQQQQERHDVPRPPVPSTSTSNPRDAVETPKS